MRAAIAFGAAVFAVVALWAVPAAPSPAATEKCRATLVYRGVTYYGLDASHLGLRPARAAGVALEPQCTARKPKFRRVAVRRVTGVRPRVALARRDVPSIVYVAADRCRTAARAAALLRCLRRS